MKKVAVVIVCLLAVAVLTNGCCNVAAKRDEARAKACSANMRVMQGCIEMYNMDHSEMMKTPEFSMFQEGGVMMQEKLLRQPIQLPSEKCSYLFHGDFSIIDDVPEAGVIKCSEHGSVADIEAKYSRR
ncbi:MAG: hypothetical protein CVV42_06075 [Candidatus Riflebacteria bacterium HGW-Riflebacteria-2]|jgi:competence protein ComGC|nr:MAG: hypothetical protein CVV42_06075 [Candidatus Riflebacteria bacterium HGW-Riflebacteria-2]